MSAKRKMVTIVGREACASFLRMQGNAPPAATEDERLNDVATRIFLEVKAERMASARAVLRAVIDHGRTLAKLADASGEKR